MKQVLSCKSELRSMKEINSEAESIHSLSQKDGLNTDGMNSDQSSSTLSDSPMSTPVIVKSAKDETSRPQITVNRERNELKWYIVLFNKPNQELKFKRTVQADKEHAKNILEVYCPTKVVKEYHKERRSSKAARASKGNNNGIPYKEIPLFAGSDFVYASYEGLSHYLKEFYPSGSIQYKRRLSPDQKSEPLTVPEDQMYEFRNFNDNMVDYVVKLDKPFKEYAFNKKEGMPNDTLKIVDGILAGLTGYFTKIDGNRGMVFHVNNPYGGEPFTFAVPNIWNFNVVRLYNAELDKQTIATAKARAVDLLVGMLQCSGYDDTDLDAEFNLLLRRLSQDQSLQKIVENLIAQRRAVLAFTIQQDSEANQAENSSVKEKKQRPSATEQEKRLQKTKNLAERAKAMSPDDSQLLFNLGNYIKDHPQYVKENWHQLAFRSFLTPTSGVVIPEGNDHAVIDHGDYKEIIKRVDITEDVYYPTKGMVETEESRYYAHVGIKKQDNGYIIFTNWDKFLGAYFSTDGLERIKLLGHSTQNDATNNNGAFYIYAKELYKVLTRQSITVQAVHALPLKNNVNINVLSITISDLTISEDDVEDSPEIKDAVAQLIDTGVRICKQIASTSHLSLWRGYLASVWLHK